MATEGNKVELYLKDLGGIITKYRKEKGYTLEDLGFQIGLDRHHMHKIEKGKNVTIETIVKLCLALGIKPNDLFKINFNFEEHELSSIVDSKRRLKKRAIQKKKTTPKKQITIKKKRL